MPPLADERSGSSCPHLGACPMFEWFSLAASLEVWKTNYCRADFTRCARFEASARGRPVAPNLLPNGSLLRKPGART
ncbi:MAG: hypothetical protein IT376_01970 [Polyangiaceae bacterium]|nr:hypothetical protein [Polyangiaceae bacterium]